MTGHQSFVTGKGAHVMLGPELGRGGEGSVYEIRGNEAQVAKLYHSALDDKKQAKLILMASRADAELLKVAAWPQETLHTKAGGPVVGFLMPSIKGATPLHELYSPAHRKQDMPKAAWNFLVFAARNTAAAFAEIHGRGNVLGDVNENTAAVGSTSRATIIDCDSMQISNGASQYLCEVGVPHFTPPELQSVGSFDRVARTNNHDNFGLALLLFHLLFGGRHPYSGVPLRGGVGESLEGNIRQFAFAYARDAQSRGLKPPPKSIPLALVPESMAAMFTAAFTEKGAQGQRPTAREWVAALDDLRSNLQGCSRSKMHVFSKHLKQCPWCTLEKNSVVYFIDLGQTYFATATGFVLAQVWAQIESIRLPTSPAMPTTPAQSVKAEPMPSRGSASFRPVLRVTVVLLALLSMVVLPKMWFVIAIAGAALFAAAGTFGVDAREPERRKRKQILDAAQAGYNAIEARLRTGPEGLAFAQRREQLHKMRSEYQQLADAEKSQLEKLKATAIERQKHQFLSRFFIDQASIPGVGPAKRAALRSWGIETAADVDWRRVNSVKGFGSALTSTMVGWRKSCEARFIFNPASAVSPADEAAVRNQIAQRRRQLEDGMGGGVAELTRLRQAAIQRIESNTLAAQSAARELAQAQANYAVA